MSLSSGGNGVSHDVFAIHWSGQPDQTRPAAAIYDTVGGNTIQANSVGVVPGTREPLIDPKPNYAP